MLLLTSRRSFIGGLLSALTAPAIVHAANIMPVRSVLILPDPGFDSFDKLMPDGMQYQWVDTSRIMVAFDPAWELVPASRFNGMFAITGHNIEVGNCVLMERPKAHCISARNEEIRAANQLTEQWARTAMADGFEGGVSYSKSSGPEFHAVRDFGAII